MGTDPSSECWQQIERLYHGARDLDGSSREAFLDSECPDPGTRREVESLLQYDAAADGYLERTALEESASFLVSDRGPLPAGRIIGGFRVLSLLGAGGMGEVYRARDVRLERDVALKVLERFVATDPAYLRRFEAEARAASGLTHPNIVTIYGVGEDEDVAFIAMELVNGRTLREVLSSEAITVGAAIDIAAQLADALAAAHAAGIVHRDLKPENLMVTPDGLVKVLDFGIAKRTGPAEPLSTSRSPQAGHTSTRQTTVSGTEGYMSPEQADGRLADHRSDQFSFGAIVYEMLSHRRAIGAPDRLPLPAEAPAALRDVVHRCLAPHPDDRYTDTSELALMLRQLREDSRRTPGDRLVTRRHALWMAGAAALTTVAGAATWSRWAAGPVARSLAVLPFANVAGNPDVDYLCDGITESLIRRIGYVPDIAVRPRSAVFNFKDTALNDAAAGRQLGVDTVLTGSVVMSSGRLEVDARVVDVSTGATTWSDRYARPVADLLGLQHDLAIAILDEAIRRSPGALVRRQFERNPTEDGEANDCFIRGVYRHRQGGEQNYLIARSWLAKAVARDPTFALAHVSLASTFTVMAIDGFERPTAAWPESNRSIRRALEIDPDLPEAHSEQSSSWFFFDHDWEAAEREWTRALSAGSSPAIPDLLNGAALKLWALGRTDDALVLARRARTLDPLTPRFGAQEGDLLLHAGRLDDAAQVYADVLAREPEDPGAWFGLAETRRAQGQFDEAITATRRGHQAAGSGMADRLLPLFERARGEDGYRDVERAAVTLEIQGMESYLAAGGYLSPLDVARGFARLGEADRAFQFLDAAFEENSPGLVFLNVDRAWASLRGDDRLAAAARAVGLTPAQ